MRYFTMAWWRGIQTTGDGRDAVAAYASHFSAIRDRLPPDLLAIEESVSLHDARLRELRLLIGEGLLSLDLVDDEGERLTLVYSRVERFESSADPGIALAGPSGYGDLGYIEAAILSGGAFEHRLLFSAGIELAVVFRGFKLQRSKQDDSSAPPAHGGV